jgi:GT2 family glycosyltransferase
MTVSIVVPTKNRPDFLVRAVGALLAQTRPAAELIVVDQSDRDDGARRVRALVDAVAPARRPRLVYLLERGITGAAAARNLGLAGAAGEIVVFCDDDVLAASDVIERLLAHYRTAPDFAGLAPVITNYEPPSALRRLHRRLFFVGPFHDERQPVYWWWQRQPATRMPVRMFTGAMMSFRREALAGLRFDDRYRGASVGEDMDLCWSLWRRGRRLAIVTDARIVHDRAPRPARRPEEAQITSWGFLYDKHLPKTLATRALFAWYVLGVLAGAVVNSMLERTLDPLRSAVAGVRGLFTDYAGSTFLAAPASPVGLERQR